MNHGQTNDKSTAVDVDCSRSTSQGFGNSQFRSSRRNMLRKMSAIARNASTIFKRETSKEPDLDVRVPYHYKPGTLSDLLKRTKFNKRELQMLYRSFKQSCPNGIIDINQFKAIYQQFFPQGDPSRYAQFVFNTFDTDGSGSISFDEFCVGLSVLSRGSYDEKMMWIYKLYDTDNDGLLNREDIYQVVASMYAMMGTHAVPTIDRRAVNQHVDFVFRKMDEDNDGAITEAEFIIMGQDKEMQDSLACLFNTKFTNWE